MPAPKLHVDATSAYADVNFGAVGMVSSVHTCLLMSCMSLATTSVYPLLLR